MATVAVPGQILAPAASHVAGPGTHVFEDNILASIAGPVETVAASQRKGKPTVSVARSLLQAPLPSVNSIVFARVIRVQARQLIVSILPIAPGSPSSSLLAYTSITNDDLQYQAILRREDVRAFEKDKIVMNEMFRVGDIIRASVISLGDERSYYISTAGNEYGVVVARSDAGNAMVPASWKEMRDVVTGKAEPRKVAKPI
jgi:exosome complex component CSL4